MGFNGIQQDLLRFSEIYWDFVALITGFIDCFPWDLSDFVGFEVAFNGCQPWINKPRLRLFNWEGTI